MACDEHIAALTAWSRKPALRAVYGHLYQRILTVLVPGSVLEVGGGAGIFRKFCPRAVIADLVASADTDVVLDAQKLPFADASFSNIVMFDVLHHVPMPRLFLAEAQRVLAPGGRLVMLEPAITPGSYLFYRFLHPETFDLKVDPLAEIPLSSTRPYDSNQAIPTLLATRYRHNLTPTFPGLELGAVEWSSIIAYPLSGGMRNWSLLSSRMAQLVLALEERIPQSVARCLAFRTLLVIERNQLRRPMDRVPLPQKAE